MVLYFSVSGKTSQRKRSFLAPDPWGFFVCFLMKNNFKPKVIIKLYLFDATVFLLDPTSKTGVSGYKSKAKCLIMSSFRYLSSNNASLVLKGLESLLDLEELCDVTLRTEDGVSILAHRNVLSVGSPYFKAMFTGQLKESRKEVVNFKGVSGEALRCIVRFVYTSSIDMNETNVDDILSASDLFQMKEIKNVCCQFLKEQLQPSNCLGIAAIADGFSCEELWSEARKFAVKHITTSRRFKCVPQILRLLSIHIFKLLFKLIAYSFRCICRLAGILPKIVKSATALM